MGDGTHARFGGQSWRIREGHTSVLGKWHELTPAQIAMAQYVGVMTMVFVKKSLRAAVRRVDTCERGIGLLGFGVSIRQNVRVPLTSVEGEQSR